MVAGIVSLWEEPSENCNGSYCDSCDSGSQCQCQCQCQACNSCDCDAGQALSNSFVCIGEVKYAMVMIMLTMAPRGVLQNILLLLQF